MPIARHALRVWDLRNHRLARCRDESGIFAPLGREVFIEIRNYWGRLVGRREFEKRVCYPYEYVMHERLVQWLNAPGALSPQAERDALADLMDFIIVIELPAMLEKIAASCERDGLSDTAHHLRRHVEDVEQIYELVENAGQAPFNGLPLQDPNGATTLLFAFLRLFLQRYFAREMDTLLQRGADELPLEIEIAVEGLAAMAYAAHVARKTHDVRRMQLQELALSETCGR